MHKGNKTENQPSALIWWKCYKSQQNMRARDRIIETRTGGQKNLIANFKFI